MSAEELPQGVSPGTISLVFGHPDAQALPVEALAAAAESVLRGPKARLALQYGPEQGPSLLLDYLIDRHNRRESLHLTRENLIVTAGSTGAVDMIARLLAGRGAAVLVESPSYRDALDTFRDHGVELRPVPVDDGGLVVEALEAELIALRREGKPPRLLYTIPTFQNPSGVTLTRARKEAVLALAREHGFLIVEDDVYHDLAFEGQVPPSFYALAGGRGVLRVGSFSKILAAGLRLGWLVAEPEIIRRFTDCGATQMGGGANPFVAHLVAEYCAAGRLEPHVAQLGRVYRHRRDVMLEALKTHLPPGVSWTRPGGGFFIWLSLPQGVDVEALRVIARQRGVDFSPGTGFFVGSGGERNLRLAFSYVPPDEIRRGVAMLGQAIDELNPTG
jgi:2-aminoadipate transaminase